MAIRCTLPWEQLNFPVGGSVRVCCWTKASLGELSQFPTLESVWNGPAIKEFRRAMAAGEFSSICPETCPHFISGSSSSDRFEAPEGDGPRQAVKRAIARGAGTVPVPPLRFTASLDDQCSLRCVACRWNTGTFRIHRNFFQLLEESSRGLEALELLGGEPFQSRQVLSLLEQARRDPRPYVFSFVTSLVALPLRLLKGVRLGSVVVSIDGADKSVFESIRIGAKWETVMKNLGDLAAFQRSLREPFELSVNFTVRAGNFEQIPQAVALFEGLGITLRFRAVILPPDDPQNPFHRPEFFGPLAAAIERGLAAGRREETRQSLVEVREFLRNGVAYSLKRQRLAPAGSYV